MLLGSARICFTLSLIWAMFVVQEGPPESEPTEKEMGRPTLGGTQYWTDQLVCHEWRIQRNVQFGQFRLLQPSNRAVQNGSYDACRRAFDVARQDPSFAPIPATVVVTVHGLGRTRNSMSEIGKYLSENGGFGWINFGYASTRSGITDNARSLRHALDELTSLKRAQDMAAESIDDADRGLKFHFVAHSLGNILVRKVLHDLQRDGGHNRPVAWQVGRFVMLGPPNQGSAMASLLQDNPVFRLVAGSTGQDLGVEWKKLQPQLGTPPGEFAIIAGGKSNGKGFNLLLSGDDDLIVRVEETKLSGAADFAVIPAVHTILMDRVESKEMSLRFLQIGSLSAAEARTPIP